MPLDQQQDSLLLDDLALPYDLATRPLADEPRRLVGGLNSFVTTGGAIKKRPGTVKIDNTDFGSDWRPYRLWIYETLDGRIYVMCSAYESSTGGYVVLYNRLNGVSPGWTKIPTVRGCNASTSVHECSVARGWFFVRYTHASQKYCSVIFDGSASGPRTMTWGTITPSPVYVYAKYVTLTADVSNSATTWTVTPETNMFVAGDFTGGSSVGYDTPYEGQIEDERVTITAVTDLGGGIAQLTVTRAVDSTTAAAHLNKTRMLVRKFATSDKGITVNIGWQYSMCYKSITGSLGCRAAVLSDLYSTSATGNFKDKIPKMYLLEQSDTTNIPTLVVLRTTDGGGTFYQLEETANGGTGGNGYRVYEDENMNTTAGGSGTGTDPQTDAKISTANVAPSTVSNAPPPMVNAPLVTGTDAPVASTRIMYYASRFWYGIENILHYSGNEEIIDGIPEECWPSGTGAKGNNFRFKSGLTQVEATDDAGYIMTRDDTYRITGVVRDAFAPTPVISGTGAAANQSQAITRTRRGLAWLTQDYRVVLVEGDQVQVVSDELRSQLTTLITSSGSRVNLTYFASLDQEWLVVTAMIQNSPTLSRVFVLDIRRTEKIGRPFWYTPWDIRAVGAIAGRINDGEQATRLVWAVYTDVGAATQGGHLVYLDTGETTYSDDEPLSPNVGYEWYVKTNPFRVPAGNHVNSLREPALVPVNYFIQVNRTVYDNDAPVRCIVYRDKLSRGDALGAPRKSARHDVTDDYAVDIYDVWKVGKRISVELREEAIPWPIEIQELLISWTPDSGSGV